MCIYVKLQHLKILARYAFHMLDSCFLSVHRVLA